MNPQEPTAKPHGKTPPIAERTRLNYLQAIKTAVKSSVAKRTTDWEEPAIVSLTEVVTCWRRWNIDQLCRLNFDQGLKLPPQEVSCG